MLIVYLFINNRNGILKKEEINIVHRGVLQFAHFLPGGEQAGEKLQIHSLGASPHPDRRGTAEGRLE